MPSLSWVSHSGVVAEQRYDVVFQIADDLKVIPRRHIQEYDSDWVVVSTSWCVKNGVEDAERYKNEI
jgi:GTP cyclohydrolase III